MDTLLNIVQTILGMGAVVILPIMIFILGLIFRMSYSSWLNDWYRFSGVIVSY